MPSAMPASSGRGHPTSHPLEILEMRRLRGLSEVRELEALRARRPLLGFEERSLRRSQSLVKEMDDQIRELLNEPAATPSEPARKTFDLLGRFRWPAEPGAAPTSSAIKS